MEEKEKQRKLGETGAVKAEGDPEAEDEPAADEPEGAAAENVIQPNVQGKIQEYEKKKELEKQAEEAAAPDEPAVEGEPA